MRKFVPRHIVNTIWQGVRNVDYPEIRSCPCCPARMEQIPVDLPVGQVLLDVCPRCQFIWFDAHEFSQFPQDASKTRDTRELPAEAKERLAMWQVEALQEKWREEQASEGPDELWKYIPALMGMPVEVDYDSRPQHAWVTWGLVLLAAVVSALAFSSLPDAVGAYGMIPSEIGRLWGATLLTSFFLHAGPMHLLSNLYYLLAFGDNVEAVLGHVKFFLLVLFATLAGGIAHALGDPSSTIPCIGASGGISGVLAFYAIAFPGTRLGIFLISFVKVGWARVPAMGFFLFWAALQLWGGFSQIDGIGSVSYLSHLGGVVVGVVFAGIWRVSRSFSPSPQA